MGVVVGLGGRDRHRRTQRLKNQGDANASPEHQPALPAKPWQGKRMISAAREKGSILLQSREFGAGDRDRTDDIQLGKLTFYH